ncbi:MAG: DEAD/DEAH box helicase family protein [Candidatus Thermoplasmatota archaeon]|nr:DEAD/DEAH box helicase family protein [Candidatus Thermoplasmatota archaeon]
MILKPEYNTEEDNIIEDLYAPCLAESMFYDRAVGYFRANIYRELGVNVLNFVISGGKVRIVCSPDIPEPDENAAREGYELRGKRTVSEREADLLSVIHEMEQDPDELDCLNMLRLLIEKGSLDLFIAVRRGGIFHRKIGRFKDSSGRFVVFAGSGNETESAMGAIEDWGNDEEFDVYRSWGDKFESERAYRKSDYLNLLFEGGTTHTKIRPLNDVELSVLRKFRDHNTYEDCRKGAMKRTVWSLRSSSLELYYYQTQAIAAWENAGKKGILSMATSTGKTITALSAIRPLVESGYPILVLVPTKILIEQWEAEIKKFYPEVPMLVAGGGRDWKASTSKRMFISHVMNPRIILSTLGTASTSDFVEFITQAKDLVMVADEVHRMGSEHYRRLLSVPCLARLGLSATPERLFDVEGSQALATAFGDRPVFTLPLDGKVKLRSDSSTEVPILGKFLSRYHYDFYPIKLNNTEQGEWNKITTRIKRFAAANSNKEKGAVDAHLNDFIKLQLIKRARIIKNAESKIKVAQQIVEEKYPPEGKWIVYCDNETQMNSVWGTLVNANPSTRIWRYFSGMSADERELTLGQIQETPGIVVSIKCLDEGVNMPSVNGAIILASSTNPREYIQRRGRVLRLFPNKGIVQIIDTLVLPEVEEEGDPTMAIVRSELSRAYSFAQSATNKEVSHRLWRLLEQFKVANANEGEWSLSDDEE